MEERLCYKKCCLKCKECRLIAIMWYRSIFITNRCSLLSLEFFGIVRDFINCSPHTLFKVLQKRRHFSKADRVIRTYELLKIYLEKILMNDTALVASFCALVLSNVKRSTFK